MCAMVDALKVIAASKNFGSLVALGEVSFSVPQGEFFGLLGPNGAGKTTLISAIAGLHRLTSGSIEVMGYSVERHPLEVRRVLGVVPQELVFDPFFTVHDVLKFQSGYFGITNNGEWIDYVMRRLDLVGKADTSIRRLSGGMKRRVMIAQALVHRPKVIILDEPTAGVDVELRHNLWDFIRDLHTEGRTVILTTHYLEEAEALCRRMAFLRNGRLLVLEDKDVLLGRTHGTSSKFEIVFSENPGDKIFDLNLDGVTWEPSSNETIFLVKLQSVALLGELLMFCRAHGLEVCHVRSLEPDLEEVFIRFMREELQ